MMKKKAVVIAMAAALAVSQYAPAFAAPSPNASLFIDSDSDGSDFGGSRGGNQSTGGPARGGALTPGEQTASRVTASAGNGTATHNGGHAIIGDTGVEFVQGSDSAVIGLPSNVVSAVRTINSGNSLAQAGTGLDLNGYNALVGTTAVMTYQPGTRVEKTGAVDLPLYVPNLVDGLGTVQVLFYNNMTSSWELLTPTSVDAANKSIHVTIPNSGTFSVVYKR